MTLSRYHCNHSLRIALQALPPTAALPQSHTIHTQVRYVVVRTVWRFGISDTLFEPLSVVTSDNSFTTKEDADIFMGSWTRHDLEQAERLDCPFHAIYKISKLEVVTTFTTTDIGHSVRVQAGDERRPLLFT
jgi:hypothetical protein